MNFKKIFSNLQFVHLFDQLSVGRNTISIVNFFRGRHLWPFFSTQLWTSLLWIELNDNTNIIWIIHLQVSNTRVSCVRLSPFGPSRPVPVFRYNHYSTFTWNKSAVACESASRSGVSVGALALLLGLLSCILPE